MLKTLTLAASAAAMLFGAAEAAVYHATDIDWANNGTVGGSNDRDDETNALGAPNGDFLSIGLSNADGSNPGFAVFKFDNITFAAGSTASLFEVTFNCTQTNSGNCTYPESAEIWYGTDYNFGTHDIADIMDDFTLAGEIFNGDAQTGGQVFIPGTFTYIAVIDTTRSNFANGPSTDGFDIDAIAVTGNPDISEVPVPGAALLMASGAIMAFRRRKA
ncbi:MAG: hypothetical protein V2I43_08670 [Parvularcula sp.]|jgi:hypothetical protein|nr:hypothetical protein [Parvularcula sp.]